MTQFTLNQNVISELEKKKIFPDNFKKIIDGKNSNAYCLINKKEKFLLKFYRKDDINRIRLKRELDFLEFLDQFSFSNVPKLITSNHKQNWILMSWIDGTKIKNVDDDIIDKLLFFLCDIQKYKNKILSTRIKDASEACFSMQDHLSIIKKRMHKIQKFLESENFLSESQKILLLNAFKYADEKLFLNFNKAKDIFNSESFKNHIESDFRVISPSDVGFHNCLLSKNEIYFIDFEYSGWDDPLKLICDLVLQPEYNIPIANISSINKLIKKLNLISDWKSRLEIMLDIYSVKWFCIILNPLIDLKLYQDNSINTEFLIRKAKTYLFNVSLNISVAKSELCGLRE